MSFADIKPYFRARMTAIGGLKEWKDAFPETNIPGNVLDKAWHIIFEPASTTGLNQTCLTQEIPVTLNLYFAGYQKPGEAIDTALTKLDAIYKEVLKHSNRLTQPEIKNVLPEDWMLSPFENSNDNIIRLSVKFTFRIILEID